MFNINKEKTIEELAHEELLEVDDISSLALDMFISQTRQAYDTFWFGKTPVEEKLKILGSNAIAMFTASAQAQGFIKLMRQGYIELSIPDGIEIKWNQDGSAEILSTPEIGEVK